MTQIHKGTEGEKDLQQLQGSTNRANRFYYNHMRYELDEEMKTFITNQEMVFMATSDAKGNCDCTPRFGPKGFMTIVDNKTLVYPEYRGNGVFASLGNISENPHIGLVFVDFFDAQRGLHVNGSAQSYRVEDIPNVLKFAIHDLSKNHEKEIERWVIIEVHEAYIHCSKNVPQLFKQE